MKNFLSLMVLALLSSCSANASLTAGDSVPVSSKPNGNKAPLPAVATPSPKSLADLAPSSNGNGSSVESLLTEDLIRTLRDPFQPPNIFISKKDKPLSDLETYQLKDLKLNGVITGPKKMRAMVTAPNGKGYFVSIGEKIGVREGRVTSIQAESVKVVEYEIDEHGKKIPEVLELRLNGDVVSITKKEE